jgi:hypothetical protein
MRLYFAVPFGDMMIAGCFGLLVATAEVMSQLANQFTGRYEASLDAVLHDGCVNSILKSEKFRRAFSS